MYNEVCVYLLLEDGTEYKLTIHKKTFVSLKALKELILFLI